MARTKVQYYGTGRRKTATARVYLRPGNGRVFINKRPAEVYFCRATHRMDYTQPLDLTETAKDYDIFVNVRGGGHTGQAGAVRLGISRALLQVNPAFRPALKSAGFLTRDARKVERKKYGKAGARASFQFSKR
ncbi:MAG: small subunit ribosomal protein S9 [Kiritimatiellia bacterium]|jgi:small subunit ribosomal protein S9